MLASVLSVLQPTLWAVALVAGPLVVSSLVVGLTVGLFQAATQIQELTLSFLPKLIIIALLVVWLAPWMSHILVGATEAAFHQAGRVTP